MAKTKVGKHAGKQNMPTARKTDDRVIFCLTKAELHDDSLRAESLTWK